MDREIEILRRPFHRQRHLEAVMVSLSAYIKIRALGHHPKIFECREDQSIGRREYRLRYLVLEIIEDRLHDAIAVQSGKL